MYNNKFPFIYIFIFIKRGADIAYRMTDQTTVDREVLRTVVTSVMSWPTYEEEDLVRSFRPDVFLA